MHFSQWFSGLAAWWNHLGICESSELPRLHPDPVHQNLGGRSASVCTLKLPGATQENNHRRVDFPYSHFTFTFPASSVVYIKGLFGKSFVSSYSWRPS